MVAFDLMSGGHGRHGGRKTADGDAPPFGHTAISNARAKAAGLGFRPMATTVRDTLAWWATVPEERRNAPRFALTPEQEATVRAAWKARKG